MARKRIRLPREAYGHPGRSWLVTIHAQGETSPFADPCFAGATLALVVDEMPKLGMDLHVACLMPDHAHLLITVVDGDLVAAIGAVKSRSTVMSYGFGRTGPLWQRSFNDVGLHNTKAVESAFRYVLSNPVEAGLAASWEAYDLIAGPMVGR